MSPTRHDAYVERRQAEKERNSFRKAQRNAKRKERAAFTH
jgi:hypothetical protein